MFKNETQVWVTHNPKHDGEYDSAVRAARAKHNRHIGRVSGTSDAHGLCYEVVFAEGWAWYEPDELSEVAATSEPAMVRQCCDALCSLATEAREAAETHRKALDYQTRWFADGFYEVASLGPTVAETWHAWSIAEARLAGARQLAEALGLIAKVTP